LWELREIDLYSFQGLLKEEGKEKYGDRYAAWKTDPANFEIDGHFPVRELWERGAECWESILDAEGQDILVVAHNACSSLPKNKGEVEERGSVAESLAKVLVEEGIESIWHDSASFSSSLAYEIANILKVKDFNNVFDSTDGNMRSLRGAGTTVLIAEESVIAACVARALQVDGGLGVTLGLSTGGMTLIDFRDQAASIACINYTAHL